LSAQALRVPPDDHVVWELRDNLLAVDGGFLCFKKYQTEKEMDRLWKSLSEPHLLVEILNVP
jgi:hypothetical protein